jgi:hypothetical protein
MRSVPPRRIGIVIASALVSGVVGVAAYWKLAGHMAQRPGAGARSDLVAAKPIPAPASPPAASTAPPAATSTAPPPPAAPAATPATPEHPIDPPIEPAVEHPVASVKHPGVRPKAPVRPPRPGRRVATAAPGSAPPRGVAPAAPPPAEPPAAAPTAAGEPAGEPPVAAEIAPAPPRPATPSDPAGPVAVGPGSLDAVPAYESLDVRGSMSTSVVKRSMERQLASLRACYQTAARAGNATPAVDLKISLEIDENGAATHVTTSGTGFGSLASCAAGVLGGIHTQQAPDTGTAQVSVLIRFRPS